jgi:XisH protein
LGDPLSSDLGAEKVIAATRTNEKILVEVKSFLKESLIYEFHRAVGQVVSYQVNMEIQEPSRIIFLAIPQFAWEKMVLQPFYNLVLTREHINCVVFDPETESIILWKKSENLKK